MTGRSLRRRVLGYALWQWRRRPPALATADTGAPSDRVKAIMTPAADRRRHVVLLADRDARWRTQRWLRTFFDDDILVFAAGFAPSRTRQPTVAVRRLTTVRAVVDVLRTLPAPDLIVDLRPPAGDDQRDAWRVLYPAVHEHGAYVHLDAADDPKTPHGWARSLATSVAGEAPTGGAAALAAATTTVQRLGEYVLHLKRAPHYLKVPDGRAASLTTRSPGLRVELLDSIAGAEVNAQRDVHGNGPSERVCNLDTTLHAPEATMRHYEGPMRVLSHMALTHERTLLPPSFRYPNEPIPTNVLATDVTADFATLPASAERPLRSLEGDFYDLTTAYHAHFGHFITEVPAKLWGWDAAKRRFPDLKALIRVPAGYEPTYERELLTAYGLGDDDVRWQPEAASVSSWLACTPLWQNHEPYWFHPAIHDVWARLRAGLVDPDRAAGPRRLFVSRRPGMAHRDCRNAADVEAVFREYGFDVVYPEDYSLTAAATLFADADAVAGFGGSGLFNILFSRHLRTLIVINHEAYLARNEHLYAVALGAESHYFWSEPDVPQTGRHLNPKAFHSAWDFDFERNGAALRETLAALTDPS